MLFRSYITDGNAITLTLNKSYETISGLRKEEMVGRSMAELVASRVISGSGTLLALERRESVTMEQQFKTGKRAIITSTPVFDSESNIVMVVTNVRDVTELYSLKEQLEQSEERNRLYSAELEAARSRQDRNPSSLIFHDKSMQNVISLLNRAAQMEVPVLLQGETSKGQLLQQFVSAGNALLVATSSFWEGVDVRGDALSLVIIDKLPFTSPDDPLLKARMEDCRLRGGDPFDEVQLPDAVITLKQGVGRLIRDIDDRGVLVICDNRLVMRPYGAVFLASLPPAPRTRDIRRAVRFLAVPPAR